MADSLILMVLALVVFGPRRLPQIGRQIGKLMYEFRKASNDFKFQMEEELRLSEEAERRKKEEEQRKLTASTQPADPATAAAEPAPEPYPPMTGAGVTTPAEDAPRVQPPSTGEVVAADKPGAASAEVAAAAPAEPVNEIAAEPTGADGPATEAASNHG